MASTALVNCDYYFRDYLQTIVCIHVSCAIVLGPVLELQTGLVLVLEGLVLVLGLEWLVLVLFLEKGLSLEYMVLGLVLEGKVLVNITAITSVM